MLYIVGLYLVNVKVGVWSTFTGAFLFMLLLLFFFVQRLQCHNLTQLKVAGASGPASRIANPKSEHGRNVCPFIWKSEKTTLKELHI